jgi:membrane-bound ClpP family serine protease
MTGRLIFAIVSTLLEEAAIAVIVLWGLPRVGIQIPLWGLIVIMVVWVAYSIITFRLGTRALIKKQIAGLSSMIGTRGEVVSPLTPEGLVRIKGELWVARSATGEIKPGGEVIVVGQEKLKLVVRESDAIGNVEVID